MAPNLKLHNLVETKKQQSLVPSNITTRVLQMLHSACTSKVLNHIAKTLPKCCICSTKEFLNPNPFRFPFLYKIWTLQTPRSGICVERSEITHDIVCLQKHLPPLRVREQWNEHNFGEKCQCVFESLDDYQYSSALHLL